MTTLGDAVDSVNHHCDDDVELSMMMMALLTMLPIERIEHNHHFETSCSVLLWCSAVLQFSSG